MRLAVSLFLGLTLWSSSCRAQEGGGWWRQLFKTGTVSGEPAAPVEMDVPSAEWGKEAADERVSTQERPGKVGSEGALMDSTIAYPLGIPGSVTWDVPAEILALDSGRPEAKDIRIPGFRVQVFMGKLDSARQLKRSLELEKADHPIYVTPYPPLFGVTVGNFTTSLAAHRVREAWRPRFPNALVVPLGLPLDAVFPPGNSPAHGPHLPPTHRD